MTLLSQSLVTLLCCCRNQTSISYCCCLSLTRCRWRFYPVSRKYSLIDPCCLSSTQTKQTENFLSTVEFEFCFLNWSTAWGRWFQLKNFICSWITHRWCSSIAETCWMICSQNFRFLWWRRWVRCLFLIFKVHSAGQRKFF